MAGRLWAMLSVSLRLEEQDCRLIATDVAYQLAKTGKSKKSVGDLSAKERKREPTLTELQSFLDFVKKPKGEQEFFHRTVFRVFDENGKGYLDSDEFGNFLDIFYKAGSIFAGDARLPPKELLKEKVFAELDTNGDGKLDFQEIRSLISGGAQNLSRRR